MERELFFEVLFAGGAIVAAGALALAFNLAPRRLLAAAATLVGGATVAAWVFFALDPADELLLSAGGLSVCFLAALASLPLRRALERGRSLDAELDAAGERLRELVHVETQTSADAIERLLSRTRADSLSLLADEERRIAEERRRALIERERQAGAEFTGALADAQRRVEARLASFAEDLDRAQQQLATQLSRLAERQKQLVADAEARLHTDVERLELTAQDQHAALVRLRDELGTAAAQIVSESTAELEAHAAERRRALHELSERLRRRERELTERIEREESEAVQRIAAGSADLERRALENLERANDRAWTRFSEAATQQFGDQIKQAREDAARRLSRELDRAVESFAREASRLLGEQVGQTAETAAQRLEKRMGRVAAGIERQRDELVAALEQRLADAESDFRRQLQTIALDAEAERTVLEARLHDLAQRVEDAVAHAQGRLGLAGSRTNFGREGSSS